MKTKNCSRPHFLANGDFAVLRFVPGDHVKIEFDARCFVEVVVLEYTDEEIVGEKPSGKEGELPF